MSETTGTRSLISDTAMTTAVEDLAVSIDTDADVAYISFGPSAGLRWASIARIDAELLLSIGAREVPTSDCTGIATSSKAKFLSPEWDAQENG